VVPQRRGRGVGAELGVVAVRAFREVGAVEPLRVHGQEGDVVHGVDESQGVVELQAVQHPRSIVEAEDVVGDQVPVSVDDVAACDPLRE
jgi:hypothetical protein